MSRSSSSPTASCPEAIRTITAEAAHCRSVDLYLAPAAVSLSARSRGHLQARHAVAQASEWLLSLLALEVPRRVGRPAVSAEIRGLVRTISRDNPLLGVPTQSWRVADTRIDIAQLTIARYMSRRRGPPSPGWRAFLLHHAAQIAAVDLFVIPTVGFKLLYGLVILRLERRQLV
jgi:hypothetical protein